MKIFKCQTCGLDKTLESKTKQGKTFFSCPNWRDPEHQKARDEWKRSQGAPQGTQNAPGGDLANGKAKDDIYDLLTTLVAKVNAIYEKLNAELPAEEEF